MTGKRAILVTALLSLCIFNITCDKRQPDAAATDGKQGAARMDPKEDELTSIPVGIEVTHSPNPVKAGKGRGRSGYKYTWTYTTSVRSTGGPLTLEEFGCFALHQGRWAFSNHTGKPFSPDDFADWYSCPNARLESFKLT
jgi:hypothetical protein